MTRTVLLSMILATLIGAAASAQSSGQRVIIERGPQSPARQDGMVRVQMSIQLFLSGPTDDSEEAEKQRERARRALYNLSAKECDVLRETIARDCRLDSININLNRQRSGQTQGYAVNGSMAFQITLK